jgi:hypothetical protein
MSGEKRPPVVLTFTCRENVSGGYRLSYKVDIDRDEWDGFTPEKRANLCEDIATDQFFESFSYDWEIEDPSDAADVL